MHLKEKIDDNGNYTLRNSVSQVQDNLRLFLYDLTANLKKDSNNCGTNGCLGFFPDGIQKENVSHKE